MEIAFNLVKEVLGKLGSTIWDEIGQLRSLKDDVTDLKSNFSAIQAVLLDAEERSIVEKQSHSMRHWLGKLKDAAYDVDDLLDEIQTEAVLQQQQPHEEQNQLWSWIYPKNWMAKFNITQKMKELRKKIDKIAKQRHDFGLVEAGPRRQTEMRVPRDDTISVVDEEKIVGRDDDKENIVKLLLETGGDHDVSVIPIVGLGGLGKTTLAQLAFNDGRVKGEQRFDLRVWVCVSTDFNMKTIAKPVISAARENCDDLDNADAVARCLIRIFSQKRFFLVLDDIWNEEQDKWENLKVLFKDGKKGSKILVTTRSEKVAMIMKTVEQPHRVKGLSDDDCWKLFKRRAFEEGEENDHPHLVEIGKQIVNKCGGLPLAVNALGSMMRFKNRTEDAWLAIRNNEIWTLKEEKTILPSLKLSYIQMSSALKQCFAYCSIFPKDSKIDKDDLIRQWIALGFVSSHEKSSSMEDIGNEYFNDLLWMSFLQNIMEYDEITCRMHDLVHDLAQSVAREEVAVIVGENSTSIPEGCRYASIHGRSIQQVPTTVKQRLRALQFGESASLTTFCSECSSLLSLPSSSSELRQLEELDISDCKQLCELPKMIENLTKLTELLNKDCLKLKGMPRGIGKLVSLWRLPIFVISKQDRVEHCASISELKQLNNLSGRLEIKGLENVTNPVDAKAANLIEKKNLSSLELKWNVFSAAEDMDTVQSAEEMDAVLENLQPHQNLRELVIEGYAGGKFPSWMMNRIDSCLPKLVDIELVNIPRCSSLPPLGLLPVLKELIIRDMPTITNLGVEFDGDSHINESANKFPALRRLDLSDMPVLGEWVTQRRNKFPALVELSLKRMPVLREWVTVDDEEGRRERVLFFPCLDKLWLEDCPQLRPEPCLPASVGDLTISRTSEENLSLILERATMDIETQLDDGDGAVSLQLPNEGLRLGKLTIRECQQVTCLPESLRSLTALESLTITDCKDLERIEDWLEELTKLNCLEIDGCSSLRYLPVHKMTTLTNLSIENCCDLERIEDWLGELTKLKDLKINRCSSLRYLPVHKMTTLQVLYIEDCPLLFNAGGDVRVNERPEPFLPSSVEELDISGISKECLSLILKRPTPDDGDAVSLQQPNMGLQTLRIKNCQQLTCLPEGLRSFTSLTVLTITDCGDLERIEDWLGELTKLYYLHITGCQSLCYLPAHKMTTLQLLDIDGCPLLFNADGQFVDTNVDHIPLVTVDGSEYNTKKE